MVVCGWPILRSLRGSTVQTREQGTGEVEEKLLDKIRPWAPETPDAEEHRPPSGIRHQGDHPGLLAEVSAPLPAELVGYLEGSAEGLVESLTA